MNELGRGKFSASNLPPYKRKERKNKKAAVIHLIQSISLHSIAFIKFIPFFLHWNLGLIELIVRIRQIRLAAFHSSINQF